MLDAETDMDYGMVMCTFQEAEILRVLSNRVTGTFATRLEQLMRTKRYRKLLSDYGYCKTRQTRKTCKKDERKALEERRKSIGAELTAMQKEFHITKDDVRKEMESALAKDGSRINSIFCLNAAMDIWQGIEKVLYGNGKRLHFKKRGNVAADIGTQSVAAGSKDDMLLENLAERNYKSTMQNEAKECRRLRKLDRSRRAMNPENYNPDGTIKPKKDRKPWKYSKTYQRTLYHHREEARKNAESRKYANRELANHLREMGDTIYTETKNAEKLKRKAKASKVVVTKDGKTKNTKRKRFGHSI